MSNQDTAQDNKQESQQWLTYLETCIEEQQDELDADSQAAYYEAVRDMLLHQGDLDKAISQTIERCYTNYVATIDAENVRWQEDDVETKRHFEYDISAILNSITNIVFETVREMPYPDPKTEILAQFLIKMANNIPPEFRKKDADAARDFDGIQAGAREPWDAYSACGASRDQIRPGDEERAHVSLNTTALIARLFQADLLGTSGPRWIAHDIRSAFEMDTEGDITKHPLKQAQILAVANYLLIAGDGFAKVISIKKWADDYQITAEKWQNWTSKLQEMTDAVNGDTRWNLKERLQKAHDKMVEIQKVL